VFPIPDEATKDAIAKGRREVFQAYLALYAYESARLRHAVQALPDSPRRTLLAQRLDGAEYLWATVGNTVGANLTKRVPIIEQVARLLTSVQQGLEGKVPAPAKNPHLELAISRLEQDVVAKMSTDAAIGNTFNRIFGAAWKRAQERFVQIVKDLRAMFTSGTAFVHDEGLPPGMAALARGHGPEAQIRVGRDALDGNTPSWAVAATLAHEGSHTLADGPTVDIVYRNRNAVYYLHPESALMNAASYEQVVWETLSDRPTPTDLEVASMRARTVEPHLSARVLVSSRITRAWVQAHNQTVTPQPSPALASFTDVPLMPLLPTVVDAYLKAWQGTTLRLMRLVDNLVINVDNAVARYSHAMANGVITATVKGNETIPNLAGLLLKSLCQEAAALGSVPVRAADLETRIINAEQHESDQVRDLLNDLYSTFS
jgi:hypothetical protein